MTTTETLSGGCLCGAIRYSVSGAPTSTNVCYCTQCQKQTGAPLPAFASYAAEQFTVTQGTPRGYRSSERAIREFCGECGSTLFWRESGSGELDVFLGSFDEPSRLPPPRYAIWTSERLAWLNEAANLPGYSGAKDPAP